MCSGAHSSHGLRCAGNAGFLQKVDAGISTPPQTQHLRIVPIALKLHLQGCAQTALSTDDNSQATRYGIG